jgi:hypothetical protein
MMPSQLRPGLLFPETRALDTPNDIIMKTIHLQNAGAPIKRVLIALDKGWYPTLLG